MNWPPENRAQLARRSYEIVKTKGLSRFFTARPLSLAEMRAFLVMIVAIGLLGSLVSRPSSRPSSSPEELFANATGSDESSDSSQKADALISQDGAIELQRNSDGHFYADVEINGASVHMLVDTGATGIALSRDDARKAGIATSIGMTDVVGEGADGSIHGEFVTIDRMSLGSTSAEKMEAIVLSGGEQSLLGQEFLKKFASVEIHGDTMTLR
jgi:aspartyl protease family protein